VRRYLDRGDLRDHPDEYRAVAALCTGSVLDVGCAFGALADYLPRVPIYVGVDVSEIAIARARKDRPGRLWLCGDIAVIGPAMRGAFDTVFAGQLLEHYARPAELMDLLAAIARRRVIVTVPRGMPSEAAQRDDRHATGWRSDDELCEFLAHWGEAHAFEGAPHHCCAYVDKVSREKGGEA